MTYNFSKEAVWKTRNGCVVGFVEKQGTLTKMEVKSPGFETQFKFLYYNEQGTCCIPMNEELNIIKEIVK